MRPLQPGGGAFYAGDFASGAVQTGNLRSATVGALSSMAFLGVGQMTYGASNLMKVGSHAVVGGAISSLQGGKFVHGFVSAGITKGAQVHGVVPDNLVSGTIVSAIVGGTVSELTGGKFRNGAVTGAFQFVMNEWISEEMAHEILDDERELLRKLTQQDLDALARGIGAVDALINLAETANSFRDLLEQLDAEQLYVLGKSLNISVVSPNVRGAVDLNRVLIDTRMSKKFLKTSLPFAAEAGSSATEVIYSSPFKAYALREILPANAFRAYQIYGRYETIRDLWKVYRNE
ncbi:hypothetical protein [Aliidiomarina indica]|uniref:hypothetical protein n=1 Tax=Aliidiomarina indica TaxID=2749147 RepID=UPI00188EFA19|nr:hypothetical protein [Aliidiomarina indica]